MKHLSLAVAILGLMIRGYFMYQKTHLEAARQTLQARPTAGQPNPRARNADAEADEAAWDDHPSPPPAAKAPATVAKAPAVPPAAATTRPEIEAALKDMHVTTIMPGSPGMFILGKQDYSEGEDLPLPKGRKARIVAVDNEGVRLTCEGMAFHLDAPAAPDLAALRKKPK